jgi:hypothetical protein
MATKIVTKNSSTASAVPTASDLVQGELAVNVADKRLFTEDNAGAIVELGTNPSGNVTFQDNGKATFGAGDDLQIYHNATSNIIDSSAATLAIQAPQFVVQDATGAKNMVWVPQNGGAYEVQLSHDGSTKLTTTSTGIDVTGNLTMASGGSIVAGGANDLILNAGESGTPDIYLQSGSSTKVKIEGSNGNVGIGTSSPSSQLHISSTGATTATIEAGGGGDAVLDIKAAEASGGESIIRFSDSVSGVGFITYAQNDGGSDYMRFGTASTERMRIDSSGNVLVGTTTADGGYDESDGGASTVFMGASIGGAANGSAFVSRRAAPLQLNRQANDGDIAVFRKNGTTVGSIGTNVGRLSIGSGDTGVLFAGDIDAIYPANGIAARDSAIDLGVSGARFKNLYLSGGVISQLSVTSETEIASYNNNNATGAKYKISFKQNGTQVGVIEVGTSSTSYATSSDYRLKENVVGMSGATERLKQLKPSRFNFIADADTTVDGFLAHEVQDIVPEAISGTKDAMRDEEYEVTPAVLDDDGNVTTEAVMGTRSVPDYQGIDQSKLVPLLVATIQELEARITQLENN